DQRDHVAGIDPQVEALERLHLHALGAVDAHQVLAQDVRSAVLPGGGGGRMGRAHGHDGSYLSSPERRWRAMLDRAARPGATRLVARRMSSMVAITPPQSSGSTVRSCWRVPSLIDLRSTAWDSNQGTRTPTRAPTTAAASTSGPSSDR